LKRLLYCTTGLRDGSTILAKGRPGERITDEPGNRFHDHETLWACGFCEGDTVGFLYLGNVQKDIESHATRVKEMQGMLTAATSPGVPTVQ
jgi:hypothetical protein